MGRVFGAIIMLAIVFAAIILGLGFIAYAQPGYHTVALLPVGTGPGHVAAAPGGADEAASCPLGIEALDGERVALADIANSKIFQVDTTRNSYRENALEVDPSKMIEGLLFDNGAFFLWTQDPETERGAIAPLRLGADGQYRAPQSGGFIDGDLAELSPDALERMADLGFEPSNGGGFLASPERRRSPMRVVLERWTDTLDLPEGQLRVDFERSQQGDVEFRIHTLDGRTLTGAYVFEGDFVSAHLYRARVDGRAPIVISESRSQNGVLSFAQTVLMVDLRTKNIQVYRIPTLAGEICQPKQNLTISASGGVYTASVTADAVRINRIEPSNPLLAAKFAMSQAYNQYTAPAPPSQTPPASAPAPSGSPTAASPIPPPPSVPSGADNQSPMPPALPDYFEVRRGETITRRQVIRNACLYLQHPWAVEDANYNLTGRPEPWRRPNRLEGKLGMDVRGLPYAWGGADRLTEFDRKITMGRPAGDVCTPHCGGNVVRDEKSEVNGVFTAGVDCSGFVLRAWGWRGARYTTSGLAEIATPITLDELRPGDILNDAGSHVRMFMGWRGPSTIEFVESSVSCGGVCRRALPLTSFRNYAPMRPAHLSDDGAALALSDIDALCPEPTGDATRPAAGGN